MSKVLESIPGMRIQETVKLWRNALRILADSSKRGQHGLARRVVEAIGAEWQRRRKNPLSPDEMFAWPTTVAGRGRGDLDAEDWIKEGVLKYLGYKVGSDGEVQGMRERILAEVFGGPIPPVFPKQYLDEWGNPASVLRLRKMAETIAAMARNGKRRRDALMDAAVRDWEVDLEFLYYEYYVGKFHFEWPKASV